jgi:ribosomal protein S18 acetylase RimI-like enzyme
MEQQDLVIRVMTMEDFDEVHALWMEIHGFGIRSVDDSREGIERFIRRNPDTSMVAVKDGRIVGAILCGHDGRRGCLYHVCVREAYRKHGIGQKMVTACLDALRKEKINKVNLIAFQSNEVGNRFWQGMGWNFRNDVNYYECILNEENVTRFNP